LCKSERECLQDRAFKCHGYICQLNIGDLTPHIEDDDECNEDFRVNPLHGGEVDVEA